MEENAAVTLTLAERQAISNKFLSRVEKEATYSSFPAHWEVGYLRGMLDTLICKFPEVAEHVKR